MTRDIPHAGQNPKKKPQVKNSDNFIEAIKGFGTSIAKQTAGDLIGGVAKNTVDQIFGKKTYQNLEPNQTIDLSQLETPKTATVETYFKPFSNPLERKNNVVVTQAELAIIHGVEQVRTELKILIAAARDLSKEAEKAVSERPVNPGIYHLNFFERLITILKLARQQIEESKTWLSLMQSKKAQKGYWAMFKKHGTSFAMSDERAIASSMG